MEEIGLDSFDILCHVDSITGLHSVSVKNDFASTILQTNHVASSNCRMFSPNIPAQQTLEKIAATEQRIMPCGRGGNCSGTNGVSAEAKMKVSWGDPGGPKVSFSASGEAHDNRGNYIKGELTHEVGGLGDASFATGFKKEEKKDDRD